MEPAACTSCTSENVTFPLGPEEENEWWWATARESVTTLGLYVMYWRQDAEGKWQLEREYYHYISQILNHDCEFAGKAVEDLLSRLPLGKEHRELHVRSDCGPHFRAYEFLWFLVVRCQKEFPMVFLHFFVEHHGKGRNDGQFGLQRRWIVN